MLEFLPRILGVDRRDFCVRGRLGPDTRTQGTILYDLAQSDDLRLEDLGVVDHESGCKMMKKSRASFGEWVSSIYGWKNVNSLSDYHMGR